MISAGFEVRTVTKEQVDALVKKINDGVKPSKAREELKLDWGEFNECIRLAARELQHITPQGRFIASAMWRNYIPVNQREGLVILSRAEKAVDFFEHASKVKFKIPEHPDIEYIPDSRLTEKEKKALEAAIFSLDEDTPLCAYSPVADHDGLRKGETYWFTREGAEKLGLTDSRKEAGRVFASKGPVGDIGQMAIKNSDVSYSEARSLKHGGYVVVEATRDIGLGDAGFKIKRGELCWMKKDVAKGLTDVTEQELARRERKSEEVDKKLADAGKNDSARITSMGKK